MQPINEEELKQLIKEAKAAGKNVDDLEQTLAAMAKHPTPKAEKKKIATARGTTIIQSTGPARKEDFDL